MDKLHRERLKDIQEKREKVLSGGVNCIPSPFRSFREEFPGIEQGKYYLVSGNEKSAKSQITDFLFLLSPIIYAFNNPDKVRLKILYFSLEMAVQEKYDQLTCFWIYWHTGGRIRVDSSQLNSINKPLGEEVIELLKSEEYIRFFNFLEENVIFDEKSSNPFGIYKACREFAEQRGHYVYKTVKWRNEITGEYEDKKVIDHFEKDDKDEYWIAIVDHLSLLSSEKGMNLRESIGKFSSKDCVNLRNYYKFTIVNIQQQSAESQSNETFKLDRLTPHPGNLAENKSTKNDLNVMLGIFSPYRFKKSTWEKYNINLFQDNIRFLEVVLNRNGRTGGTCALYFDGAVNFFQELPSPSSPNIQVWVEKAKRAQGLC